MRKTFIILTLFIIIFISGCTSNCETQEKDINQLIDSKNYCGQDSDCILLDIDYGCPFGCYNLINKNEEFQSINDLIMKYAKSECSECMYKCPQEPKTEEIECINNKCIDTRYQD